MIGGFKSILSVQLFLRGTLVVIIIMIDDIAKRQSFVMF